MLVTVIIPTFNRAESVLEAIQSVKLQTYPHVQIIVIDDGSTDNTREKLTAIEGIEYYYQRNGRQASARNLGLRYAKGEFIATLDSDDVWNEDFLSECMRIIQSRDLDFVFTNWKTKKDNGLSESAWLRAGIWQNYIVRETDTWHYLESAKLRKLFVSTCPAPSSALLFRRSSIVTEWNPDLKIADDWCFVLDLILAGYCRAAFTLIPMWVKNVQNDNIYDGQFREKIAQELEVFDTRMMLKRFESKLNLKEMLVLWARIKKGQIISLAFFLKNILITKERGLLLRMNRRFRSH